MLDNVLLQILGGQTSERHSLRSGSSCIHTRLEYCAQSHLSTGGGNLLGQLLQQWPRNGMPRPFLEIASSSLPSGVPTYSVAFYISFPSIFLEIASAIGKPFCVCRMCISCGIMHVSCRVSTPTIPMQHSLSQCRFARTLCHFGLCKPFAERLRGIAALAECLGWK